MKKIFLLIITSLAFLSFTPNSNDDFDITGKWKAIENGEIGYIIFQDDGYALFEIQDQIIGGKEFEMNGKKGSMRYEIDYSKTPMTIDLIVTIFDDNKTKSLLSIAEKIDDDNVKIAIGFEGERPTKFNGNDEMTFKRVKT